jgi:hypothetical protein
MSLSITTGSVVDLRHIDADPDPTYPDADPYPDIFDADPDPSFQIKGQNFANAQIGSYSIHFCLSAASFCGSGCALDADPGSQNDADSVES